MSKKETAIKIKTKAAKGFNPGDAANSFVRALLSRLSNAIYSPITEDQLIEIWEKFDRKDPYTGDPITEDDLLNGNYELDHIIPQNKDYGGLNVYGNIVLCKKETNRAKSGEDFETFLKNNSKYLGNLSLKEREDRIIRIKKYQKESGFDIGIFKRLTEELKQSYKEVTDTFFEKEYQRIEDFIIRTGNKPHTKIVFEPSKVAVCNTISDGNNHEVVIEFYAANGELCEKHNWHVSNFSKSSSLLGNIQSKQYWRNRSDKIKTAKVFVKD